MKDFVLTALPLFAMGLTLALSVVKFTRYKKAKQALSNAGDTQESKTEAAAGNRETDYSSLGMSIGISAGVALGVTFMGTYGSIALSYGICFGMLGGLLVGSCIKKK